MKSNFLKTVLPAFALILAITASLAFTSSEDAALLGYTQVDFPTQQCNPVGDVEDICQETATAVDCTISAAIIFKTQSGTQCSNKLFERP